MDMERLREILEEIHDPRRDYGKFHMQLALENLVLADRRFLAA